MNGGGDGLRLIGHIPNTQGSGDKGRLWSPERRLKDHPGKSSRKPIHHGRSLLSFPSGASLMSTLCWPASPGAAATGGRGGSGVWEGAHVRERGRGRPWEGLTCFGYWDSDNKEARPMLGSPSGPPNRAGVIATLACISQ